MNMDKMRTAARRYRALREMGTNDILGYLDLERRRSITQRLLPLAGSFGMGFAVGVAAGVLFAPMSGAEIRHRMMQRASDFADSMRREVRAEEGDGAPSEEPSRSEERGPGPRPHARGS